MKEEDAQVRSAAEGVRAWRPAVRRAAGKILLYFALTCAYAAAISVPEPGYEAHAPRPAQSAIQIIGDDVEFATLARNPEEIFAPRRVRMNRPGVIWPVAALNRCVTAAWRALRLDRYSYVAGGWPTEYIAYNVMNGVLLLGALLLFDWMLAGSWRTRGTVVVLSLFLMIGQITDISFWHPHTGMFMLFTPVCVTALGLCVLMRPGIGAGRVAWVGFALGLGNLCYGAFIVGLPVVGLAVALSADRDRPLSKVCRRVAGQWGVLAAAALGPSLLWLLLLRAKGIVYYNHEVESAREFIWPMDALRIGGAGFLVEFVRRSVIPGFLGVLFREIVPYLLLAVGGLGGCVAMGVGRSAFGARERRVLLACALASAAFLPFILAMGLYISRIQWMAAAPVLVAAGVPILLALSRASGRTRLVIHILLVAAAVLPLITGIRKVTGYGLVRDELQAAAAQRAAGH